MDRIIVGGRELHGRAYVAGFSFKGSDQQKKVGELSGGERNRVLLAKVLRSGGNVLLLDEPTNDLDVDTLRALEDAFLASPVARWSSATTAGSSTASPPTCSPSRGSPRSGGGRGTSATTRRIADKRLGVDADQPHRLRYKPLVRDSTITRARRRRQIPQAADVFVVRRAGWTIGHAHARKAVALRDLHDAGRPGPERVQVARIGGVRACLTFGVPRSTRTLAKASITWSPSGGTSSPARTRSTLARSRRGLDSRARGSRVAGRAPNPPPLQIR